MTDLGSPQTEKNKNSRAEPAFNTSAKQFANTIYEVLGKKKIPLPSTSYGASRPSGSHHKKIVVAGVSSATYSKGPGSYIPVQQTTEEEPSTVDDEESLSKHISLEDFSLFMKKTFWTWVETTENLIFWFYDSSWKIIASLYDQNRNHGILIKSPLTELVDTGDLYSLVMCLVHGFNQANDIRESDGNTPLHCAVQANVVSAVWILLIFGADPNILNNDGKTALHLCASSENCNQIILHALHTHGARRCKQTSNNGCSIGCSEKGENDGQPYVSEIDWLYPEIVDTIQDDGVIGQLMLSLDGGGVCGLVFLFVMREIQKKCNVDILKTIDIIAGTSTGGIAALAIGCGKSLDEILTLYIKLAKKVFAERPEKNTNRLFEELREVFETKKLESVQNHHLLISAVNVTKSQPKLEFFNNLPSGGTDGTLQLVDIGRATSAAPTYFNPHMDYVDGGLLANNPTADAIVLCKKHLKTTPTVVSLGCGLPPVTKENPGRFRFKTPAARPSNWSVIPELLDLLQQSSTMCDGSRVDLAQCFCADASKSFVRINPYLQEQVKLDETDMDKLVLLAWSAHSFTLRNTEIIEKMARIFEARAKEKQKEKMKMQKRPQKRRKQDL